MLKKPTAKNPPETKKRKEQSPREKRKRPNAEELFTSDRENRRTQIELRSLRQRYKKAIDNLSKEGKEKEAFFAIKSSGEGNVHTHMAVSHKLGRWQSIWQKQLRRRD